jgi:hypothetical protein
MDVSDDKNNENKGSQMGHTDKIIIIIIKLK